VCPRTVLYNTVYTQLYLKNEFKHKLLISCYTEIHFNLTICMLYREFIQLKNILMSLNQTKYIKLSQQNKI